MINLKWSLFQRSTEPWRTFYCCCCPCALLVRPCFGGKNMLMFTFLVFAKSFEISRWEFAVCTKICFPLVLLKSRFYQGYSQRNTVQTWFGKDVIEAGKCKLIKSESRSESGKVSRNTFLQLLEYLFFWNVIVNPKIMKILIWANTRTCLWPNYD